MLSNDTLGARQTGLELYKTETGQKGTIWDEKANEGDAGALPAVVEYVDSPYYGQTFYYIRHNNEEWNKTFTEKVSLMYLHDYYLSVSDLANCQGTEGKYANCKTGWMHLSQNDNNSLSVNEWTMSRIGWSKGTGYFEAHLVYSDGSTTTCGLGGNPSVRPVFYINASEKLLDSKGTLENQGTIDNPFIIKS